MPTEEQDKGLFKHFRNLAKTINFGIIYGMGRNKLAITLNIPVDETVRAIELALLARETMPEKEVEKFCTLFPADLKAMKEDHRVNTSTKNWDGLRRLKKSAQQTIDLPGLTAALVSNTKNLRLMYSAETFLNNYHERFPKIKELMKSMSGVIGDRGYIFNRFGRRYHLTKDQSYISLNRWVQGTCADMVKMAMIRVHNLLEGKKSKLINQVHDELQADIHHSELYLVDQIKAAMEYYPMIKVKTTADCDYTHTAWSEKRHWKDAEEFKKSDTRGKVKRTKKTK
jgi:DNA polymerase I-like protein with 3'-5' exonuclease and polymerase domains